MSPKSVSLTGTLQIGNGKPCPLMSATPNLALSMKGEIDLLISGEDRHVWLKLNDASARALAEKILKTLEQQS